MADTSSDDSDIELLEQITCWEKEEEKYCNVSKKPTKRRANYFHQYEDYEFTYRFRLTKTVVEDLLLEVYPYLRVTSKRNHGTAPLHQLLLTLRFYALGGMLESVAEYSGVSISSASRIIRDISIAISKLSSKYVCVHKKTEDEFYKIAQFPRVLGAIDCTHVLLHTPGSHFSRDHRIKKSVSSLKVQAVCDANLTFMNIVTGCPGTTHNTTVFNQSKLRGLCENGVFGDKWLLGDNTYPCKSYLLTPITNPQTTEEENYNDAHFQTRYKIERCFDSWRKRFPILLTKMRLSLNTIQDVIIATATLHNICRQHNIVDLEPELEQPKCDIYFEVQNIPESSTMNEIHVRQAVITDYFASC